MITKTNPKKSAPKQKQILAELKKDITKNNTECTGFSDNQTKSAENNKIIFKKINI